MKHETTGHDVGRERTAPTVARKPYERPEIETLGGTLAVLLASGCLDINCTICLPGNPGNGNDLT